VTESRRQSTLSADDAVNAEGSGATNPLCAAGGGVTVDVAPRPSPSFAASPLPPCDSKGMDLIAFESRFQTIFCNRFVSPDTITDLGLIFARRRPVSIFTT
jgi:hypothetical protein